MSSRKFSGPDICAETILLRCHIVNCVCPLVRRRIFFSAGSGRHSSLESRKLDGFNRVSSFQVLYYLIELMNEQTGILAIYLFR